MDKLDDVLYNPIEEAEEEERLEKLLALRKKLKKEGVQDERN